MISIHGQMCHTYITLVVYCMCFTCVMYVYVLHMYYTCISTWVIHVQDIYMYYMCKTCVLQVFYSWITGVSITYEIHIKRQITQVLHAYYMCTTHVIYMWLISQYISDEDIPSSQTDCTLFYLCDLQQHFKLPSDWFVL